MAVNHYENFPVASLLVPRRIRPAVVDIYRFARSADDIADEGHASAITRQQQLEAYRQQLLAIEHHAPLLPDAHPLAQVFTPLRKTIQAHQLPIQPFLDLLSAFSQDIEKTRYATREELLDYCSRSANPVGRLMLHLYQADTPVNHAYADQICTGLQLVNFWQDVAIDWQKDRVYIPQQVLQEFDITENHIAQGQCDSAWQRLMHAQTKQAQTMLTNGFPLVGLVGGRLGLELKFIILGGLRIIERLEQLNYDVFTQRPTLKKSDWFRLFGRALVYRTTS